MDLKDIIKDYKLRHLSIGQVKNLDKENFKSFCIEKISWDVHWQTNLFLAVIIRDYLRFFTRNTLAIGNCVFESDESFLYGLDEVQCSYYMKKWETRVNMVTDEFDELIHIMLTDSTDTEDYLALNNMMKKLEHKAFDDLCW